MKLIYINQKSHLPKYKQIVLSIENSIMDKVLKINDKLPSINKIKIENNLSRDTVLQAYNELKKRGIIYSILGKGYFVKSNIGFSQQRFIVIFDELNYFKENLFYSFLETIDNKAQVDIFFHHFNVEVFEKLIEENNGNYSKYIVMPSNFKRVNQVISKLPKEDTYILDQINEELFDCYGIYQNFEKDIFIALELGKNLIDKYQKLILVFPNSKEPLGMKIGFISFCEKYNKPFEVIYSNVNDFKKNNFETNLRPLKIAVGELYIIPNDRDLVEIIEKSKNENLKIGTDVGIISYNDTSLKKIVENGITTISTDFHKMGHLLAKMILNKEKTLIENESNLIVRNSV